MFFTLCVVLAVSAVRADDVRIDWKVAVDEKLQKDIPEIVSAHRNELKKSGISLQPDRQTKEEKELIEKKLRSEGYYAPGVKAIAESKGGGYAVDPGRRFKLGAVKIKAQENVKLPPPADIGLEEGAPMRAEEVLKALSMVAEYVDAHNCLYNVRVEYEATINSDNASAGVTFIVKESPEAVFGNVSVEGLRTVHGDFALHKLGLKQGACFKRTAIAKARQRLQGTNLFSRVAADIGELEDGKADVVFNATERSHRTIKAGVNYDSQNGPGVTAGWEHRNIFGEGQKLETGLKVSTIESSLSAGLTFPSFLSDRQSLVLTGKLSHEETDAFDSDFVDLKAALQRKFGDHLTGSFGTQYKVGSIKDADGKEDVGLLSLPVGVSYDRRDNVLDPLKGFVLGGEVRPSFDTFDAGTTFVRTMASASGYYTPEATGKGLTLAARLAAGVITGVGTATVPADERFYAGGGNSVRGYGFQQLGPVTAGIPDGGRSYLETSVESRFRLGESWGGALFVDGGNVYDYDFAALGKDLRWSAGAGVRYYTGFAPVRFDVAVPLNKRRGDDAFQIYVSLGQAF